jgi:hypothetical protein
LFIKEPKAGNLLQHTVQNSGNFKKEMIAANAVGIIIINTKAGAMRQSP